MSIQLGSNGILECNTVRYNYKQARNLCANADFEYNFDGWTNSNCESVKNYAGYKSYSALKFNAGVNAEIKQNLPTLFGGHKYYFGILWKTPDLNFTKSSGGVQIVNGNNVVVNVLNFNINTNNKYEKLSTIFELAGTGDFSGYQLKCFVSGGSLESFIDRIIFIDLTSSFGLGNEPTKEWCNTEIIQWEQWSNCGFRGLLINSETLNNPTFANLSAPAGKWGFCVLNSTWEPRDYMYLMYTNSDFYEAHFFSSDTAAIVQGDYYYGFFDAESDQEKVSLDMYVPEAEPQFGSTTYYKHGFNGGGDMSIWKRASFYNHRSHWASGNYQIRLDLNNNKWPAGLRLSNISLQHVNRLCEVINQSSGTNIGINDINKEFCDRWVMGKSNSIIQIKDPKNTKVELTYSELYDLKQVESGEFQFEPLNEDGSYTMSYYKTYAVDEKTGELSFNGKINSIHEFYEDETYYTADSYGTKQALRTIKIISRITINTFNVYSTLMVPSLNKVDDIACNDILIDPTVDNVRFLDTGTVVCKKLIKTQKF